MQGAAESLGELLVGEWIGRSTVYRARGLVGEIESTKFGQRLHRRSRTQALQPIIEIALHSIFHHDRAMFITAFSVLLA